MATFKTDMRDREPVLAALAALALESKAHGSTIIVAVGARQIVIDLATGLITASPTASVLVARLRQLHAEMLYRRACREHGIVIEERQQQANGDIVMVCRMLHW